MRDKGVENFLSDPNQFWCSRLSHLSLFTDTQYHLQRGSDTILSRGGGGVPQRQVSMPVGTSRCMHWFEYSGGNCLHCLSHWGKICLVGESGIIFPLRTRAGSAPWRPSHANTGMLHTQSFSCT